MYLPDCTEPTDQVKTVAQGADCLAEATLAAVELVCLILTLVMIM